MNNNLIEIQAMLMRQMKRLDNENQTKENIMLEISRGNSLSQTAVTFIKNINVNLRIFEIAKKYNVQEKEITKNLGIFNEK